MCEELIRNKPTTVGRDRDGRYDAPVRAAKKLVQIFNLLQKQVKYWGRGDIHRLYFRDRSYLWCDETGSVRTSGGLSTKAKFEHQLR
jgi:hypothetical protein